MKPEDLAHAKAFMAAVETAMTNTEALVDSVREGDRPLLFPDYHSYRDGIDPEKFKKLEDLVYFLCEALFGEDCDSDSIVRFKLLHLGVHENILPFGRVPRLDDDASLEERFRQWKAAQSQADIIQGRANDMKKWLDEDVEELVKKDTRLRLAEDCPKCRGKGWVEASEKDVEGFYYGIYCRGWGIGAGREGPYRFPCECQSERDLNGWPLEPRPKDS